MDRVHRICRQSNGGHCSTGSAFTKNNVEEITIAAIAAVPRPHPGPRKAERIAWEVVEPVPPKSAPPNWTRPCAFVLRFKPAP